MVRSEAPDDRERVSIVEIGDSHTAGDAFSAQLRRLFASRLGSAGRGYAHPGRPWKGFRQEQMTEDMGGGWKAILAVNRDISGPLGLGGLRLETTARGAWIERGVCETCPFEAPFEMVTIHYLRHSGGGQFRVYIDGDKVETVSTSGSRSLGVYRHALDKGGRELRIEVVEGRVALFGIRTARRADGIEYTSLGLNGAEVEDFATLDSRWTQAQLRTLSPDLVMVSFGTNGAYNLDRLRRQPEANATLLKRRYQQYRRQFRELVARYRDAAPDAACLVLLPPDLSPHSEESCAGSDSNSCARGRPSTFDRIVSIQRDVAEHFQCATWNRAAAMGGEGSILDWARREPALARGGIHLTFQGYRRLATGFFQDLSRAYAAWKSGMGSPELQTTPVMSSPSLDRRAPIPTARGP